MIFRWLVFSSLVLVVQCTRLDAADVAITDFSDRTEIAKHLETSRRELREFPADSVPSVREMLQQLEAPPALKGSRQRCGFFATLHLLR